MSQKDAVIEKIGEHEFKMFMLPPLQSHDLLMDVARMAGPALGPVFDAVFNRGEGGLDKNIGPDFFTKATVMLFGGLDKAVLRDVISAFRKVTMIDNKPLDGAFEIVFLGELDLMYRWIGWGMKVQWGKSFSALASALGAQGADIKSRFPSLTTLSDVGSK